MKDIKSLDFNSVIATKTITRFGKTREVHFVFDKHSDEFKAMCKLADALKVLDEYRRMTYTQITESIIKNLQSLKHADGFTIVKFDFVGYFESLSTKYIYDYILKGKLDDKVREIMNAYCAQVPYAYAGIGISNTFADIMTNVFKEQLLSNFGGVGVIGAYSYVDDFVLIFDKNVAKEYVVEIIDKTIKQVFYMPHAVPNTTDFYKQEPKFSYLNNSNLPLSFINLGYLFNVFKSKDEISFNIGLPTYKKEAFKKLIKQVILDNKDNVEALRTYLYAYAHRVVTKVKGASGKGKNVSYSRLASSYILSNYYECFDAETVEFYKNVIFDCFEELGLTLPYYLADRSESSPYNLHHNLIKHKALVLNKKFGLPYKNLVKLVQPITDKDLTNMEYYKVAQILLDHMTQVF
ncbi:MAG: hypothetical protein J6X00_03385 [Clostridia bacterium]|nr:hypothetical protein [Clostridia bacterium]